MTQTFLSFQFSSSVQLISLPIGGHEAAEDADTMTVDLPHAISHAHVCWKHYNGLQAGHEFFRSFNVCIRAGKACPTSEVKTNNPVRVGVRRVTDGNLFQCVCL